MDSRIEAAGAGSILRAIAIGSALAAAVAGGRPAFAGGTQTLPALDLHQDPTGMIATFQPRGATSEKNPFFQSLGTNGRTCNTCHQASDGWTISAAHAQQRFASSGGSDPLFAPVDGADCSDSSDHSLLLNHGLIRVELPVKPFTVAGATPEFQITSIVDPYNCQLSNTSVQQACQQSNGAGYQCISVYRRPLPATNLKFLSTVMSDGREPNPAIAGLATSLAHQAMDATLGHAQAAIAPTDAQLAQIVDFETGLFTAQFKDNSAGILDAAGADGGPKTIAGLPFHFGINDALGGDPSGAPFDPEVFTLFTAWLDLPGKSPIAAARESVARGEDIFNTRTFQISTVGGLADQPGTCSVCHDTPNVGNHSFAVPLAIGTSDPDNAVLASGSFLPVFTLSCIAGPLAGQQFTTTDPGRALVTGKCDDIGKVKGPILHGMAARAPYFHNGSAATLAQVVEFYEQRFSIGLSESDKADLVAFLQSL